MFMSHLMFVTKHQQGQITHMQQDMNIKAYLFINARAHAIASVAHQCMNGAGVSSPAGYGPMSHVAWIVRALMSNDRSASVASEVSDADAGDFDARGPTNLIR